MKISNKGAVLLGSLGLIGGVAGTIAMQTHAADSTTAATSTTTNNPGKGFMHGTPPAAAGKVTAVNGSSITVTDSRSGTAYTVDTASAIIEKFSAPVSGSGNYTPPTPTTISVSDIKVDDNVMVQGTISGNNIAATKVVDGLMGGPRGFGGGHGPHGTMGTVSFISGNTITLTGANGAMYTVDAASASVKKISAAAVSDIQIGDKLEVSGSTSGTTVTASNILDGELGGPGLNK